MKRCLNCRMTYSKELSECPHCGYKPRSKAARIKLETTQEFEPVTDTKTYKKKKKTKNISATSGYSGSFYLKSGERLNKRYSVMSVMGFGAFGVAYECFDSFNQKNVVVKEYMPSYLVTRASNGREVEPLSDEAEVKFQIGADAFIDESNKLNDNDVECVPKLVESFKQNNTSYVVTELVRGEALSSIIKRKNKLTYHATITIITGVLQGLRKLNKVGIIHGDICPDNIIVTSNSDIYLLDYNLSDFNKNVYTQRDSGKLRAGYSALEMYYMNMEQGPWTDVYAAAATMYKMLTGITVPSAIKRNTSDSLTSLSKLGVPITEGAEKAMFKALKVDYEKRTQNPEDFLNGLMGDGFDNISVEKEKAPEKKKAPTPPSRPRQYQRNSSSNTANKILNGILTILILSIIALVIWFFISGVFPLPDALKQSIDNLGDKVNNGNIISNTISSEDEEDNDDVSSSDAFFFKDEDSGSEENDENSQDEDTYGLPDISSWTNQIESAIDSLFPSEDENNDSYNDNYDDYGNNAENWYDDYSNEDNGYDDYNSSYENNESSSDSSQSFTDQILEFTSKYLQ